MTPPATVPGRTTQALDVAAVALLTLYAGLELIAALGGVAQVLGLGDGAPPAYDFTPVALAAAAVTVAAWRHMSMRLVMLGLVLVSLAIVVGADGGAALAVPPLVLLGLLTLRGVPAAPGDRAPVTRAC